MSAQAEMSDVAAKIDAPNIDYAAISPMLIVFGAACLGVLIAAFFPKAARWPAQLFVAMVSLASGLVAVLLLHGRESTTAGGAVAIDSAGLFLQGAVLALGIVSMLLIAERTLTPGGEFMVAPVGGPDRGESRSEVFPLALFAIGGMLLFVTANDLIVMFIALEVMSLPLYLLCGMARRRRLISQEASVKYFLLGAFASAFFLYGVALLYGYANTVTLGGIHAAIQAGEKGDTLLMLGIAMLAIGLLFKASLAPFQSWTPDVYSGAPTPITAFMAACTKVAAFGGLLRVLYVAFGSTRWDWRPALIGVAILTMLVGSIFAVTQTDVKRLLAYSSVANAGFIFTGVLAMTERGVSSTLFYLLAYGFTTLGAFAIVMLVRDADGEATHLSRWAGLARRAPLMAGVMTLFMLAFAGIPLTSGFTSKFAVFSAAFGGGAVAPVIVGVIASMIIAFPYLRLVVLMYLSEPTERAADVHTPGAFTAAAITLGAVATVLLGIAPQPLLDLASDAAVFVR